MDAPTVTRTETFDAPITDLWRHLGDADGLGAWLGSEVDLDGSPSLVPGAAGTVVDEAGRARRLVVDDVRHGERLGFVWWDEEHPEAASRVELTVVEDEGRTTLTVTETLDPTPTAGGRACALVEAGTVAERWGLRLGLLADRLDATVRVAL